MLSINKFLNLNQKQKNKNKNKTPKVEKKVHKFHRKVEG